MGLASGLTNIQNSRTGGEYTFKQGVKYTYLSGDSPKNFKILPALPSEPTAKTDWLQCKTDPGSGSEPTNWAQIIYMARFIGHGMTFGGRTNILTPQTFSDGENVFCPVTHACSIAKANREWAYLILDETNGGIEKRKILVRPSPLLILNIIDLDKVDEGVQLGILTKTAMDGLLDKKKGLAFARPIQVSAEAIAENYMNEWLLGDFTDPRGGLCFTVSKLVGARPGYTISVMRDNQNRSMAYPITAEQLEARYDLARPETYLNKKDTWGVIQEMMTVLNGISPSGKHEFEFLKLAFPEFADSIHIPSAITSRPAYTPQGIPAAAAEGADPALSPSTSAGPPAVASTQNASAAPAPVVTHAAPAPVSAPAVTSPAATTTPVAPAPATTAKAASTVANPIPGVSESWDKNAVKAKFEALAAGQATK